MSTPAMWWATRVKLYLLSLCKMDASQDMAPVNPPNKTAPHYGNYLLHQDVPQQLAYPAHGSCSHSVPQYAPQPQLPNASLHTWWSGCSFWLSHSIDWGRNGNHHPTLSVKTDALAQVPGTRDKFINRRRKRLLGQTTLHV